MLNEHPLYYKAPVQVVTIFLFFRGNWQTGKVTGEDVVEGAVPRLTVRISLTLQTYAEEKRAQVH
jgi:hypothetical protein